MVVLGERRTELGWARGMYRRRSLTEISAVVADMSARLT